jgi:hypothetical protein
MGNLGIGISWGYAGSVRKNGEAGCERENRTELHDGETWKGGNRKELLVRLEGRAECIGEEDQGAQRVLHMHTKARKDGANGQPVLLQPIQERVKRGESKTGYNNT